MIKQLLEVELIHGFKGFQFVQHSSCAVSRVWPQLWYRCEWLFLRGETEPLIEEEILLLGLSVFIKFPVVPGIGIRWIEDRLLEKEIAHLNRYSPEPRQPPHTRGAQTQLHSSGAHCEALDPVQYPVGGRHLPAIPLHTLPACE